MKNKTNLICDRHLIPPIFEPLLNAFACRKCITKRLPKEMIQAVEQAYFFAIDELINGNPERKKTKRVWNGLRNLKTASTVAHTMSFKQLKKLTKGMKKFGH